MKTLKPRVQTLDARTATSKPTERTRGATWMAIRERVLRAAPHCVECLKEGTVTPAKEVDHITPLSLGGADDPRNLQGLCVAHHHTKTKAEAAATRVGGYQN
jgi:5-methylcytosine-specific restriction protein A